MNAKVVLLIAVLVLGSSAANAAADAEEIFGANCASCHGADGKARTPAGKKLRVKDLSESKLPDDEIEKQIISGVRDPNGKARMPAFEGKLSPEEIVALIAFVKALRH